MITLEQIQLLEQKVHQAVEKISALKDENATLKQKISTYSGRIEELEVLIDSFKQDQGKIEEGILSALKQLDTIEQSITVENQPEGKGEADTPAPSPTAKPSANAEISREQDGSEQKAEINEKPQLDENDKDDDGDDASREAELDIF